MMGDEDPAETLRRAIFDALEAAAEAGMKTQTIVDESTAMIQDWVEQEIEDGNCRS